MADDDHRTSVIAQEVEQPGLGVAVEMVGGLIQQQQVGVCKQDARNLDAAPLTTGQDADGQIDPVEPQAEA